MILEKLHTLSLGLLVAALPASLPAASNGEEWLRYIEQNVVPLQDEAAPLHSELKAALEEKKLVLLGETTHGTREYYTWRAAITRSLVKDAGFRFIAVEGDWTAIDPLDRYVRHLPGSAASALEVLSRIDRWAEWMWANPEILELAEWLHEWNREQPEEKRVGIHGIDVYGWGQSVHELPTHLERLEPGWGERAESGLVPLKAFDGDTRAFGQALTQGQPTSGEKVEALHLRLAREAETLRERDPTAFLQARQQSALLAQAKKHLRKSIFQHPRSWNPRAANFMATVERLRDYYGPGAKGVLWAHNTHIGDARHTPMARSGLFTVGQQAREVLGADAVYLLGFSTDRGSFRAGEHWGGRGQIIPLSSATEGSFDYWMAQAAPDRAFLPLAPARSNDALLLPLGHRAIGIVHASGTDTRRNYVPSSVPLRYDGILFLRETSALAELPGAND